MSTPTLDPAADTWLRRLIAESLEPERLQSLVHRAHDQICRDVPEIASPGLRRSLESSLFALSPALLPSLVTGTVAADLPEEAYDLVDSLIRGGLDLPVLLRVCRSGQHSTVSALTEQVTRSALGESLSQQLVLHIVGRTTDWAGTAAEALSSMFHHERTVDRAGMAARRRETVRAVLAGGAVDIATARTRLGYPLEGTHRAMVLWSDDEPPAELSTLRRRAESVATRLSARTMLAVPFGDGMLWAWAAGTGEEALGPDPDRTVAGVRVALGGRAGGVEGFRRSHHEALAAQRVARLRGDTAATTEFDTVEIEHLISQDAAAMTAFVRRELGPLAGTDPAALRLRETLRGYLDAMCSVESAARALGVHRNTVRYRLDRIEEILGHPVDSRRLKLEVALRAVRLESAHRAHD